MKSWKTTLSGIMAFITVTWGQLSTLLDSDISTNPDYTIIVSAFIVLIGLFKARDNDVSSEEAGVKK